MIGINKIFIAASAPPCCFQKTAAPKHTVGSRVRKGVFGVGQFRGVELRPGDEHGLDRPQEITVSARLIRESCARPMVGVRGGAGSLSGQALSVEEARRGLTEAPEEKPDLTTELEIVLAESGWRPIITQTATTVGDSNTVVHTAGHGNMINVRS